MLAYIGDVLQFDCPYIGDDLKIVCPEVHIKEYKPKHKAIVNTRN